MTKAKFVIRGVFSVVLIGTLMLATIPAQAQTQPPNDGPTPEGLSADDWVQIQTALPESAQYRYQAYIKASNTNKDDHFGGGSTVAFSGDTIVVGAPGEDSNATGVNGVQSNNLAKESGAAYVFVRSGNTWFQQAYLKASNTEAGDQFGSAVAISGDTIVVGASGEASHAHGVNGNQADNSLPGAGAAYVFVRNSGVWSQQAYLKPSNSGKGDAFGYAVTILGDVVVVGAPNEDSNAHGLNGNPLDNSAYNTGAAYIFTRSGGTWSQDVYLKSSDPTRGSYLWFDMFGSNVAISGETLVVGAPGAVVSLPNGNAWRCGAAYVFVRTGGVWSEQAKLQQTKLLGDCFRGSYIYDSELFGASVGISGDTIAVGVPGEGGSSRGANGNQDSGSSSYSGAVYVFVRNGTTWTEQAYLKASNADKRDYFSTVAIDADTLIVGASGEDSNATGINGNQSDNSVGDAGAIYVFGRSGTTWSQVAYLKAPNTDVRDNFGSRLAITGNTIVTGTPVEDSNAKGMNGDASNNLLLDSGAIYILDVPPYVVSSLASSPNPTTSASVDFTVKFSEPMTGVDASDFTLTATGVTSASIANVSGGPESYVVSVNTGSDDGTLRLNVLDDDSILNASNVPLGDVGIGNGSFIAGEMYVVRPTSQIFTSQGAQDGWILETTSTSNVGGTMNSSGVLFNLGDDIKDSQYRSLLHFDTDALPDTAIVTSATLRIKKQGVVGKDPFTMYGDLRVYLSKPYFGTGVALELADFKAPSSLIYAAGFFDPFPINNWYSVALTSAGRTNLNLTGPTQFRLNFAGDDNNNRTVDLVKFYSGDAPSAANRPVLVVEYYIP